MEMARTLLALVFLFLAAMVEAEHQRGFINSLEENLEDKLVKYVYNLTEWLETINDSHLNDSALGKMLHYNEIKPKLEKINEGRGMKKLGMAMLPIIFHIGATSTWLMLTGLMTVKSVAIGLMLLVFKIAVSSAKVASFFTAWKHKSHHPHDHSWGSPHHEYHGHYRSLNGPGILHEQPYQSYHPDWIPDSSDYKTIPTSYSAPSHPVIETSERKIKPGYRRR